MILATARSVLHRFGALEAYHRLRNRQTLTVLMFHRVMPVAAQNRADADPVWTVTTRLFEDILAFVSRHYNLVDLENVLAARARRARLPPRALLISFDDGWRDNLDHALPILRRHRAPAVVFAATDAIEDDRVCWWQDVVLWALRTGRAEAAQLSREAGPVDAPSSTAAMSELALISRLAALDRIRRDMLLLPFTLELEGRQKERQMLNPISLRELAAAGIGIGVHGAAHVPLTTLDDPSGDLSNARTRIAMHLASPQARGLSFPHGRYDRHVVDAARILGFELQFTSDAIINHCPDGYIETDLVGRIPVYAHQLIGPDERLSASRLAAWLFLRPREKLLGAPDEAAGK